MKTIDTLLRTVSRFAVGLGCALALICAVVIVAAGPAMTSTQAAKPAEVVRLDPVVVTISRERFDAIRAEEQATMLARKHGSRGRQG